ncbi:MAG: arginine deiminase-related protein [bacterium]|nr:arginine deiminase-related protein [bacterium]
MNKINTRVLMSGADFFSDAQAINAHMDDKLSVSIEKAMNEHQAIREALMQAGIEVIKVDPPADCQDGVYTANWALTRGNKAVMARLPNARTLEEPAAEIHLKNLGFEIIKVPNNWRFSGQGDALPCGNYLFAGSVYRTDIEAHQFIADTLGFEVISLQTKPLRRLFGRGKPVINKFSGWPDSYYYDIDLALAVIKSPDELQPGLIAWCPEAFMKHSAAKIRTLPVDKIEVSLKEAKKAFACNLVSTGESVVMSAFAPHFKSELEKRNLKVFTPVVQELGKGGGYIRCTTLTLN